MTHSKDNCGLKIIINYRSGYMFIDSLPMFYICSKNVLIRAGMIAACEYQWPANLPVLLDFPFVGYLREEARYNDFFNTNVRRKLNDLKSRV